MDERSWNSRLRQLAMTLWIGGQWLAGWGVAPFLFARLDTQLAGELAGRVFTWWSGRPGLRAGVAGFYALRHGGAGLRRGEARLVWAMLACSLANQWLIHPVIERLKAVPVDAAGAPAQMLGLGFGPGMACPAGICCKACWVWPGCCRAAPPGRRLSAAHKTRPGVVARTWRLHCCSIKKAAR